MCIYVRARPRSHPHLLVCNRRAQTGSSSTQTNNQRHQNIMRIRHNEVLRVTDVPCALPLSQFTPRGLRYPNTSALATAVHHPIKAPCRRRATFSRGHSTFNPFRIHAPCFSCCRCSASPFLLATNQKMRHKRSKGQMHCAHTCLLDPFLLPAAYLFADIKREEVENPVE